MPVTYSVGCVCSVALYSAWAASPDRARVLLYLLCRESDGSCDAKFALVDVLARDVNALARGARDVTAARLADLARAAAAPGATPLATLGHAAAWKGLYLCALVELRARLGSFQFYREARFGVDAASGLLVSIEELAGEAAAPRAAVLRSALRLAIDEAAVRAAAAAGAAGGSLARARLCALRDGHVDFAAPENLVELELVTKAARFYRSFGNVAEPPRKRAGQLVDVFTPREYCVRTGTTTARVHALLPNGFDCFVADAGAFSPLAAMLVFAQWHAALFAGPPAQILGFLGPQLNPSGEEHNYCFLLGFPGVPVVVTTADPAAVQRDLDAHVLTDGLWPAFGMHAYHALSSWNFLDGAAVASLDRRLAAVRRALPSDAEAAAWPAGRVSTILDSPACVCNFWLAKFDFSAFFPTLYAYLFPEHGRLVRAIRARRAGHAALKPSLLAFFGGLRHAHAPAYEAVIALANAVAAAVERAANARDFAVCTYVKDGFWGAFGGAGPEAVSRADALAAALALRDDCQRAAEATLRAAGLQAAEGAELHLRFEGLFTHAISWAVNKYWLWDAADGGEHFAGFPCRTEFGRMAKRSLSELLRRAVARPDCPRETAAAAAAACDALVCAAFERRDDVSFWSAPMPIADWRAVPRSALAGADRLDADHGPRPYVFVAGHEEAPIALPWALYRTPALLPAIACRAHMAPAVQELVRMLNGALAALAQEDDAEPVAFEYDLANFDFLFA
ncbi:DNA helicase/primase complex-associated protein [Caprine alphaherpesvirus 1]|uniref:DNA helicase/primase complex-associated protein n=1 Tax=Caprine alphaherpesvirus 1 TaxID=39944 RepID=A0AAF1D214_9ALPH|nr:DNA helicase/primase complex-associated protein [Caprine alphaherpesvirus 1]QBM10893.1 DNA helicase/primase complex-associated protein [Caprine alphaherpesvirus 1]